VEPHGRPTSERVGLPARPLISCRELGDRSLRSLSVPLDDRGADGATASTIIVVEPDILVRMVIASYLRDCGYKVLEGVTAADAMAVLGSGQKIDVVLSEVRLRGKIDGFALARWVREHHPSVDVILTSGVARAADKAKDLCDDGPLEKPYEPQEVVRHINLLRERRRTVSKC
jgi:CheY-like chemotaxis protein